MRFAITAATVVALAAAAAVPELQERATCEANGTLAQPYVSTAYIVQLSQKNPDTKYGITTTPKITPNDLCASINLRLPASAWNMVCRLSLKIPTHAQTPTPYGYSGVGHFQFNGYFTGAGADENTTYNHQPAPGPSPNAPPHIGPGNSYTLLQAPCLFPPGQSNGVLVGGTLCSNDTSFEWTNSDTPCALGFFVEILNLNLTTLQGSVL